MVDSNVHVEPMITIEVKTSYNPFMKFHAHRLAKRCAKKVKEIDDRTSIRSAIETPPTLETSLNFLRESSNPLTVYGMLVADEIKSFAKDKGIADSFDLQTIDHKTSPHLLLRCTPAFAKALQKNSWHIFGVRSVVIPDTPSP